MFNPQFRKFRRKKIVPSSVKSNKITNFFLPENSTSECDNESGPEPKKNRMEDPCSSSTGTKEHLIQISRKRERNSQCSNSSRSVKVRKQETTELKVLDEQNSKLTPFEQQVLELKEKYPGMMLMINSGYKYFFYGEDAEIASRVLNISLNTYCNSVRSSIPDNRLHVHASSLMEAGYKVGVIKQQEVAELKNVGNSRHKLFERELTAVYSKGTAIGEDVDPLENSFTKGTEEAAARFILCVEEMDGNSSKPQVGIVAFDVGTGEAYYDNFEDTANREELERQVEHLQPAEIIHSNNLSESSVLVLKHSKARMEVLQDEHFNFSSALIEIASFLSTAKGETEAISDLPPPVVCALAALLYYLKTYKLEKTLKPENLQCFSKSELYVQLDGATLRNLEIFRTASDSHQGSLFSLFDSFSHARFGSRVLREWLSRPLRDIDTIRQRQDAVAELLECSAKSVVELHGVLSKIPDLEHGLTAILLKRSSPTSIFMITEHLKSLKTRLEAIVGASDIVIRSPLLNKLIMESIELLRNIPTFLDNMDEAAAKKGDVTKFLKDYTLYSAVIQLQAQVKELENRLEMLLPNIARQLGVNNLKYTTVHGVDFLIEVKISQSVPLSWQKVSETKSLSRYHPPDVLNIRSELNVVKAQLHQECEKAWLDFIDSFNMFYSDHKKAVKNIAILDALIALAQLARSDEYCRPELTEEDVVINIQRGKHPVVSKFVNDFIPNNTYLETPENMCIVLSGPNMGGKSCYIKQVALITILALIGSYVPAESAVIGMIDAIYTRIGARDEIFEGRSTLMLEMQESARILHKATRHSLVLMDELGRGTSSHDGAAIAVATLSYLINKVQCLTLFVTHYPSVMEFAPNYNFHMGFIVSKLSENSDSEVLTFLYLLSAGKTSFSYGVNVSRLAGIPNDIIDRASKKAKHFQEEDENERTCRKLFQNLWKVTTPTEVQTCFDSQ